LDNPTRLFALVQRDVIIKGISMLNVCIRPQPAVAGVPAIAATTTAGETSTAGETPSDEILVERIAAGNKLAMQALFARHRTFVYRWLLRLVGNEMLAEDLLSENFSRCVASGGSLRMPLFRLDVVTVDCPP
jgi:hypothetical protein